MDASGLIREHLDDPHSEGMSESPEEFSRRQPNLSSVDGFPNHMIIFAYHYMKRQARRTAAASAGEPGPETS
jgi:hypothetical protein